MAVYVDGLRRYPGGRRWCHLLADTEPDLHAFARRLGLNVSWADRSRSDLPYYDLTPAQRAKALAAGAKLLELHIIRRLLAAAASVEVTS